MKNHYSSEDLKLFKTIIKARLFVAEELYEDIMGEMSKKDNSASDTNWSYGSIEDGTITQTREEQNIIASKQRKVIDALKAALVRIENKTYGICRVSGELIPRERLMAVPHTTCKIDHKS